ncbi:uncharacterized protein LOC110973700 [Acanthaster planci]|uniref:Uncharacterized protein LOC110973700 n=1 Tax=Acanthaster planci TaxID=133434 RepID=A0A8B7XKB8_ACAPL|nr:uncharacterized protein LOC110973700 [Acanthaster planci]
MYAAVILCILVVAASASPEKFIFGNKLDQPAPEKCCAEPYYTFQADSVFNTLQEGSLLTELIRARGAYDSIDKKFGLKVDLHISNGTVELYQLINDFKEGLGYYIYTEEEETKCVEFPITSGFPYNCIPEGSTYVGSVTIGDRALRAANWYFNDKTDPTKDMHIVFSIKEEECIDLGYLARTFDPETGTEISVDRTGISDYNLGICDPDTYFKPPEECKSAKVKRVNSVPKRIGGLRGPRGQRLFQ